MLLRLALPLVVVLAVVYCIPLPREEIPICPAGASPMLRPDGEPRRCLPHQNHLCLNALDDGVSYILLAKTLGVL